jgi:trans-aconitate 2-methyltransferase
MDWNSELYLRYERERTQPSLDLTARIPLEAPKEIIDLGCGPGNSTLVLRQRWPNAHIVGLDSSLAMIERARQSSTDIEWRVGDIRTWSESGQFDLIFANASLQWIADHEALTRRLIETLKPAGVQKLAKSSSWRPYRLEERYTLGVHEPAVYYNWLASLSRRLQIWETIYFHEMENHQKIIEFYSSTGLKPYLDGLPTEELRDRFKAEVQEAYRTLFPAQTNGTVLFTFRRLFMIVVR